jgi:hypothetical protein
MRAHRIVESGGEKKSRIIAGLKVAGPHLAPVFRPSLGNVGSGERPFAADSYTRQQAEQRELPHILRKRRQSREQRIDHDRAGKHARAAKLVGDGAPEKGKPPSDQKQREQDRPHQPHVGWRIRHTRLGK